jgi:hypothetical protein
MRDLSGSRSAQKLALRNVDDRREQQAAVLELFETEELSRELPADADLPTLGHALDVRTHDSMTLAAGFPPIGRCRVHGRTRAPGSTRD